MSWREAQQHLKNRTLARSNSVDFAGYIDVPGRPVSEDLENELFYPVETNLAVHHQLHLQALDETSQRRYGRLLVVEPPGSAKTTYGSVVFPGRYLGANAGSRLILTTYGQDLAVKMGRKTRSIIRQQRYQRLFDCSLSKESSAGHQFSLTNGSEYMAAGLDTGITGNRANGALIDDPVKGRREAKSEKERETTWSAIQDDLKTRLLPGGWLVVTMTRWDEDDVAGRILPDDWKGDSGYFLGKDGLTWRVLCLQARCETHTDPLGRQIGEYLWPEWFDEKHWLQFQADPVAWNSLFQQRPRPPEGSFFHEAMFLVDGKPIERPKVLNAVFAIIDSASKTGAAHDGTGVVFFGRSRNVGGPPLQILDWDYHQIQAASLIDWLPGVYRRLEELAHECHAIQGSGGVFIEDKASGIVLLQQAENKLLPAQAVDSRLTALGKEERARNASPYIVAGDVKITREAYEKVVKFKDKTKNHLMSQVLGFEVGSQDGAADDLLDCLSYAVAMFLGGPNGM